MILNIFLIYLCVSNETMNEASKFEKNLFLLDFKKLKNSGILNKLLSDEKTESQEHILIKEICNKKSIEFEEKIAALFSVCYFKFFVKLQHENFDNYFEIIFLFKDVIDKRFKIYNDFRSFKYKGDVMIAFKNFIQNKNLIKKKYSEEYLNKKDIFNNKLTEENVNESDILTYNLNDLSFTDECKKNKILIQKDINNLECKNDNDTFDEKVRFFYNKRLFNAFKILQTDIDNILFNLRKNYLQYFKYLYIFFFKEIKNNIYKDNEELFGKIRGFFIGILSEMEDSLDIIVYKENHKMLYDFLN